MNKLTTSILAVVLTSSFAMVSAQETQGDSLRTQDIREVVVTGALGLKKRQDAVTSANQVVNNAEITQANNPNAIQALTGKVSGLQINTTNNSVNSTTRVVLRGPRSISGNNQALVVIDGVISTLGILQNLPPEIIDNMNVIKGMQGAALYGEKGSNGVIVVTTKRGSKSERLQFTLTNSVDFSSVYKLPIFQKQYGQGWPGDAFDTTDYNGTNWTPYENSAWGPAYSSVLGGQNLLVGLPQADNTWFRDTFSPKDNHIANFFKTGVLMQNGVSVNAGGADSYVFLSVNRAENDFVVEKDNLKRNNFILKAGKELGKFRIDGNVNYLDLRTSQTSAGLYGQLLQTPTNVDIRKFRNSLPDASHSIYITNPYWLIDHNRFDDKSRTFTGLVNLAYKLNDNISFTYAGSATSGSAISESHLDAFAYDRVYGGTGTYLDGHFPSDGVFAREAIVSNYYKSVNSTFRYYGDLMANFDYNFTDDINFKLNVGHNIQDNSSSTVQVGGENLEIPGWYHIKNVLQPDQPSTLGTGDTRIRSYAWFANMDLSYKDYLFFNSTFRYEKSSLISVNPVDFQGNALPFSNKGFAYYSFGGSFVPTKAFEGLKGNVLNYAKISASYSRVGNVQTIPVFGLDRTGIIPTGYPFGSLASYLPATSFYDQNIEPEFLNSKEATLQLGFFKDRITFEGSVFRNDTDNLISSVARSAASGITSTLGNIGSSRNQGFELDLGFTPFKSKNFEWKVRGSYSTYETKILSLADGSLETALTTTTRPSVGIYAAVGDHFPLIKGTKYQRDPNGNIIVNENGNPLATSTPEVLGKVNPDYILGFSTSIKFKGITLSAVADYRTGNSFIALSKGTLGFAGNLEKSADFDRSQGYVIPNSVQLVNGQYVPNTTTVGDDPSYFGVNSYFGEGNFQSIGEEHVIDGTALKVREIALSYDIPRSVLKDTFVNSLTIGVYARNPFVIYAKDNRNFADPETSNTNGNVAGYAALGQYPTIRNYGFNLNLTF
ncbi:SusC/RagA family TonB-linked outer membrane protein [Chryseobacterium balustinum]|uniref:Outer membrane receptor for ferrienterochelin and colicins n=1 Tax=Chryseobacterium balustinum TaxID=246 RepID=A0AAX2IJ65_9FLAO|nr:SusC/RagA family TonB-linked outer membrane protein [Chryseobacterium balustinum]AZB30689.1 SusC/RagA family TonB-linked outer membrane protein [Chryseobacterium balustinum]SKB98179.1 TonB-linked outer membrane protein, SusC/RagA family [Chryseobacterium balustinum]SQA88881.1 Outer membrane receptor for ferrienterochelin and colicins [Chryseobacterium balustinum]